MKEKEVSCFEVKCSEIPRNIKLNIVSRLGVPGYGLVGPKRSKKYNLKNLGIFLPTSKEKKK